jgi:hypothetical protein
MKNCEAKMLTLQFLYYIQSALGQTEWSIANDEGFDSEYNTAANQCEIIPAEYKDIERHFPAMPYVRESRRIKGVFTLTASDIRRVGAPARSNKLFDTSIAIGDYPVDRHGCIADTTLELSLESSADIPSPNISGAFQIPFGTFIPESVDGLVAAEKNLSISRLAAGATRTHPAVVHTGQAAGVIAALSALDGVPPRMVNPVLVQRELTRTGTRISSSKFSDVDRCSNHSWPDIELSIGRGILTGIDEHIFGGDEHLTRSQAAVMLDRLLALNRDGAEMSPRFVDVPIEHPSLSSIEAVHDAGLIPECSSMPLAFCPDESVTRAEMAVMIVNGLDIDHATKRSLPYFGDVAEDHKAFSQIQAVFDEGLIAACDSETRHFCPDQFLLRAEAASVASASLLFNNQSTH